MNPKIKSIALVATGAATGFFAAQLFLTNPTSAETTDQPAPTSQNTPSQAEDIRVNASDAQPPAVLDFQRRYRDLLKLPHGPGKVEEISKLFEAWGIAEGDVAYRFAKQLTGRERLAYLASAAKGWAREQPQEAWAATMDATNNGAMLTQLVGAVLDEVGQKDPILAFEMLSEVGSHWNRNNLLPRVMNNLAEGEDRSRLLSHLLESETGNSEYAIKALFQNWGRYETNSPLAAVNSISDPKLAHAAMLGILEGWAAVDGRGAFDYIVESGDAQLIKEALAPVSREWARSVTADEMENLFSAVASVPNSGAIIKNLVTNLARADPQLALASVMSLEDPSAQANHARDALSIWADADLEGAEAYFKALPAGQTKDYAIWGLFNPAMHQGVNPARIFEYAASLSNPESVGRALSSMAEYTRVADLGMRTEQFAAELQSYVTDHPDLSEEMKSKILENLAKPEE